MATDGTIRGTLKRKGAHKQDEALAALLVHPTRKAAAEACGIGLRTMMRYLADPQFAERYGQAKLELVSATTMQLRVNGTAAVSTLSEVAANPLNPPGAAARVSAARAILEFMFEAVELEDVLERLEKLEQDRGGDEGV
jgi:hypothetical protein